jgi:F0F1-type ATP synthase assembly protein I
MVAGWPMVYKKGSDRHKLIKEVGPYINLGWQLVITIGLGALFGYWLDGRLDTKPAMTVVFSLLGVVVGMYSFLKTVLNIDKKKKSGRNNKK